MKNYNETILLTSLAEKLDKTAPPISLAQQKKLIEYLLLLAKWNQAYNLTSIRDPHAMITHHILDSLSILPYLHGNRILDVGTGAGLPGIPLAITQPKRDFVLIDSNGKKIRFLTQIILSLQLPNVQVIQSRVETLCNIPCFDTIISRAFSSLAEFLKLTETLRCPTGQWLAMKGEIPTEEIAQLDNKFATTVHNLIVPGLDAQRHLVIMKRNKYTQSDCF